MATTTHSVSLHGIGTSSDSNYKILTPDPEIRRWGYARQVHSLLTKLCKRGNRATSKREGGKERRGSIEKGLN